MGTRLVWSLTYERYISTPKLEREVVFLLVLCEMIVVGEALETKNGWIYVGKNDVREY